MIDFRQNYLLHLLVVNDRVAEHLGIEDNRAYLRAFVLKDRTTGEVYGLMRFHQLNGKSWTQIKHQESAYLVDALKSTFTLMTKIVAPEIEDPVQVFTPPRPDLSPDDTVVWLIEQDLIEVSIVEPGMKVGSPDGAL
jgi:hypothetical protein